MNTSLRSPKLEKFAGNPILEPEAGHWWESKAVFNPGALYEAGRVHLVYRALGDTDISVFGYASSEDGLHIQERLAEPIYVPRETFEGSALSFPESDYSRSAYISGGGIGGCEDPRLTRIGEMVFMTYVAYDGYSHPRIALTSISLADFLNRNWQWRKPVLISPPGVVDKNACILPERINSKYVIFHRVFPDILVDFVDDLDFDGKTWLKGEYRISPRLSFWDSRKLGAGPPPVKTGKGWLLIYQAVDDRESDRYKIGAMLLDLNDPTNVIARSPEPILEPEEPYENEGWKAGVVYPCGTALIQDRLFVYYGGADRVVCVASAGLDILVQQLIDAYVSELGRQPEIIPSRRTRPMLAFCFRCRAKREIMDARTVKLKNNRSAIQGVCPVCDTKMYRMIS